MRCLVSWGRDKSFAPDVRSYNHVLSAIATNGLPNDAQRALKVIKTMNENGISREEFTRNALEKLTKRLGRSCGDR
jgi:hypothetical protein